MPFLKEFYEKVAFFLATGFSLSLYVPFAPGTLGSLPFMVLVVGLSQMPVFLQIASSLLLALLAVPVCTAAEKRLGIKDDGRIVADEWMLLPISFIGLPLQDIPLWMILLMFAVVRCNDILKPFPCRGLQKFPGGFGIVIDDFFANIYSLAVNWAIYLCFIR